MQINPSSPALTGVSCLRVDSCPVQTWDQLSAGSGCSHGAGISGPDRRIRLLRALYRCCWMSVDVCFRPTLRALTQVRGKNLSTHTISNVLRAIVPLEVTTMRPGHHSTLGGGWLRLSPRARCTKGLLSAIEENPTCGGFLPDWCSYLLSRNSVTSPAKRIGFFRCRK